MPVVLAQALPQSSMGAGPSKPQSDLSLVRGNGMRQRHVQSQSATMPGVTAPGTGARHFPEVQAARDTPTGAGERLEKFEMRTTKDYYREFPGLVRSSTPLYLKSAGPQEPLGQLEQRLEDAGPQTGNRRMPGTVDLEGRQRPRLPSHPQEDADELRKELETRYNL